MRVDVGNALGTTPGVSRETLRRLDERVSDAHERIEHGREAREHGYAALSLPTDCDPDAVWAAVDRFDEPEAVLTVGIGGSALGAATVSRALSSPVDAYYLDNVDPAWVRDRIDALPLADTVVNVVSQSGTTVETLANFLVVREAMTDAGVDWTDRTVVTTGPEGNLRRLAETHDLPVVDVPEGVPGRFSALSTVGLVPAALQGHDVEALLAGGADADLAGSLFESPAYAYGATCYALARRGALTNAMVPYAESLETFAEWFAQLWAESLGKDGVGQTPARALGATDQHSQLQLYRAGPREKLVTLVRVTDGTADGDGPAVPATDMDGLAYLSGTSLSELLDAEFAATEASLAASGRPNVRVEVDAVDERSLGELLYGMEAACVCYGELAGVSTFTQPAVEWGKRAARGLLGGEDAEEAAAVGEKTELVVE